MPVSLRLPKRRSKKSDSPKATPKGKAAATPIKPSVDSEEAAAINALIKQADGGRDMAFLRERRMSGEPEDGKNRPRSKSLPGALDLPGMLYEAEVEEVKELLRASAKQDAGQVLRDRRARTRRARIRRDRHAHADVFPRLCAPRLSVPRLPTRARTHS